MREKICQITRELVLCLRTGGCLMNNTWYNEKNGCPSERISLTDM